MDETELKDKLFWTVAAQVEEMEEVDDVLLEDLTKANADLLDKTGKPRMLRITAWIAHEGVNLNGDGFLRSDLEEVIDAGLFRSPNIGMIDWDHDFTPIGAWTSAKGDIDPKTGTYGILAEGAVFAWRFPEQTAYIEKTQKEKGNVPVSMAAKEQWFDHIKTADGRSARLVRKPAFFTTSVLTVAPGDPNARSFSGDDPDQLSVERELALSETATIATLQEENKMEEKIINELKALPEEIRSVFKPVVEAAEKLPAAEEALRSKETELTAANEKVAALETQVTEANSQVEEVRVALEAKASELEAANVELETLRAFKAEIDAKEEEKVLAEKKEARLAELSEATRKALEAKPEDVRNKIIERWVSQDEETWEITKSSLSLSKSYEERSRDEGTLAGGADGEKVGKYAIDQYIK